MHLHIDKLDWQALKIVVVIAFVMATTEETVRYVFHSITTRTEHSTVTEAGVGAEGGCCSGDKGQWVQRDRSGGITGDRYATYGDGGGNFYGDAAGDLYGSANADRYGSANPAKKTPKK